jgi:hypothetical protein
MRPFASIAVPLSLVLLPATALPQHRGLNLQATPPSSPLLPVPPMPPGGPSAGAGPSYDVAPTPNRDLDAPAGPRANAAPQLAPGIFTRSEQYRGEGYSAGSSAQAEQERRVRPGAGFKLRLPLQQQ